MAMYVWLEEMSYRLHDNHDIILIYWVIVVWSGILGLFATFEMNILAILSLFYQWQPFGKHFTLVSGNKVMTSSLENVLEQFKIVRNDFSMHYNI